MLKALPLLLFALIPAAVAAQDIRDSTSIAYAGGPPPENLLGRLDSTDPLFNRPSVSGGLSGLLVPYDTIRFTYTGTASALLNVRYGMDGMPDAMCSESAEDVFLAAYRGSFNAAAPLRNLIGVWDDSAGLVDRCPTLRNVRLARGETVILVLTTFAPQQRGTSVFVNYEVSFAGTGDDLIFADGFD